MAALNESAVSLRWLLDDVAAPLRAAWTDVRDRMRTPIGQRIVFTVDWISDPWIARGAEASDPVLRTATPVWDPPDEVDAWPDFRIAASLAAAVHMRRSRDETVKALLSTASANVGEGNSAALEDFSASERLISYQGDRHMIFGEQVRAWILAAVGSLLRGLAFTATDTNPEAYADATMYRVRLPFQMQLPGTWAAANAFGERHLELLLNLTVQEDGHIAPLDPADLRVGQGIPWRQAWEWLSRDVPAALSRDAIRLAARLLRSPGLRLGLRRLVASAEPDLRTLATGVLRRWVLSLKAMAWAEDALNVPWNVVRPADIVCFAFSATKPEWPRRVFAISHRSADVKPRLRHMEVWKSCRYAIDATYIPGWETNTGMIWGLFAASPAVARVRTPGYETSIWCRREAEMIQHLVDRGDYLSNRVVVDIEDDELGALDEWRRVMRAGSDEGADGTEPAFPPFGLEVWSPRPSAEWELAVMRAAGALRVISAYTGDTTLVNRTVYELRRRGDLPGLPAPTNQPGGWRAYAAVFESVARLVGNLSPDVAPVRLPDNYSQDDFARDRELGELIPDLTSGAAQLGDVLVALEFLRTTWKVMVDERHGRFLVLNLQGVSKQEWMEDPCWSLHRGLATLRGTPVPVWFLQFPEQNLSSWELPGDPPILTEHVEAQFGWMFEIYPRAEEWRARYSQDSRLDWPADLLRLLSGGG